MAALARHLGLSRDQVIDRYCRTVEVAGVRRISLNERPNYDCIFWAPGRECTVYEARPLQCRAFPFWPANMASLADWQAAAVRCPGIGQGPLHSRRTIEKWLRRREREPFVTPPPADPGAGRGGPRGT
jgi:Fe-S-cluster containining protein